MDLLSFRLLFNHTKSAYNMVLAIPSNLRLFFLHFFYMLLLSCGDMDVAHCVRNTLLFNLLLVFDPIIAETLVSTIHHVHLAKSILNDYLQNARLQTKQIDLPSSQANHFD